MEMPYEQMLQRANLRITQPRLAVIGAVHAHPHADAAEILQAVRVTSPKVSHQAVYDCLATLSSAGLLRKIEPAGSTARYEARIGDNHHHLICRSCALIIDIDCAIGQAPCLEPAQEHGFAIDEAEVMYWGLCPACKNAPAKTSSDTEES